MRVRVKGSLSQATAIRMAKTALVSRNAADGAIWAWPHTQRISRYEATEATAAGTATDRPSPRDFSGNAALKDINFDFDKYDIRPADAKILLRGQVVKGMKPDDPPLEGARPAVRQRNARQGRSS